MNFDPWRRRRSAIPSKYSDSYHARHVHTQATWREYLRSLTAEDVKKQGEGTDHCFGGDCIIDLWIWHAFFGMPGSCNDINILDRSPISLKDVPPSQTSYAGSENFGTTGSSKGTLH